MVPSPFFCGSLFLAILGTAVLDHVRACTISMQFLKIEGGAPRKAGNMKLRRISHGAFVSLSWSHKVPQCTVWAQLQYTLFWEYNPIEISGTSRWTCIGLPCYYSMLRIASQVTHKKNSDLDISICLQGFFSPFNAPDASSLFRSFKKCFKSRTREFL